MEGGGSAYILLGIYCAKYYDQGGGGEMGRGKKMKNEAVGNKMKKKEKGERKKNTTVTNLQYVCSYIIYIYI